MNPTAPFDEVLAVWLAACDADGAADVETFIVRHPEHADALRAYVAAERWLGEEAGDLGDRARHGAPVDMPLPVIEGFTILREIARGGMGIVYEAEQRTPRRRVALKMLRDASLAAEEHVRRFRREAQAAAELDHPGIVRILEVGSSGRLAWYTMPLASGGTLSEALSRLVGQPTKGAVLVRDIARAVAHGHARGVLHRDLKPSNILLDRRGNPLVADFGLAWRADVGGDVLTHTGAVMGTPAYMSPEQARGDVRVIDERTDVWSLGAILYHLLTGRPPFVGGGPRGTLDLVLHGEVESVRSAAPSTPKALALICEQCLRREPKDRYASMRDLADDLDRYLQGEPIHARAPSVPERFGLWVRRRPAMLAVLVAGACALGAILWALLAAQERDLASLHAKADVLLEGARRCSEAGDIAGAAVRFAAADVVWPSFEAQRGLLAHETAVPTRVFEPASSTLWRVRWDPSGRYLAAGSAEGVVWLWPTDGPRRAIRLTAGVDVRGLAFDGTGRRLAVGDGRGVVRILDVVSGRVKHEIRLPPADPVGGPSACRVLALVWLDVNRVAVGTSDGRVHVWRVGAPAATSHAPPVGGGEVRTLAASPGAAGLLVGYRPAAGGSLLAWMDPDTGRLKAARLARAATIWDCAWRPDLRLAVAAYDDGSLVLDTPTLRVRRRLEHGAAVGAVALSPAGDRVLTGTVRGVVRAFDVATGARVGPSLRHPGPVYGLAVEPGGTSLVTAGMDGTLRAWPLPHGPPPAILLREADVAASWAGCLVSAPRVDGEVLVVLERADGSGRVEILRAGHGEALAVRDLRPEASLGTQAALDVDATGWTVLMPRSAPRPGVRVAHVRRVGAALQIQRGAWFALSHPCGAARLCASGRVALVGDGETLHLLDIASDLSLHVRRDIGHSEEVALSPDGASLLRVDVRDPTLATVERIDGEEVRDLRVAVGRVSFGAVGNGGRRVLLVDASTSRLLLYDLTGAHPPVIIRQVDLLRPCFVAQGRILLGQTPVRYLSAWSTASGLPLGRSHAEGHGGAVFGASTCAIDGERGVLVAATPEGRVLQRDISWLTRSPSAAAWRRRRLAAQLVSMQRIREDGTLEALDVAAWTALRRSFRKAYGR